MTKQTSRRDLPTKAVIKKTAHALTVLAVMWIGVSVFAMVAYKTGKEDGEPTWVTSAIWAWRIHGGIVVLAILVWIFEKPSEARYVKDDFKDEEI